MFKSQSRMQNDLEEDLQMPMLTPRGSATKLPHDWETFLSTDDNKTSLINLLLTEWESDDYAGKLQGREIIFVNQERCVSLSSSDGATTDCRPVQEVFSSQDEADTRIILHSIYASRQANCDALYVRSPDTDVFLLLLSFNKLIDKPLIFDTGTGNKRRKINITNISEKMGKPLCDAILGLHAFTGCDSTSCFAGKGKIKALTMLHKDSKLVDLFAKFGTSECITDSDIAELEAFVCKLYGKPSYTKVDKVRYDTVRQRFKSGSSTPLTNTDGIDLSQMPPCRKVLLLQLHIQRANFQTQIWRQASKSHPTLPKPEDNGWVIDSSGSLVIQWCEDDFLPKELLDIITEDNCSENEDSIDDEGELSDASSDKIMSSEDEQSDDDFYTCVSSA